MKTVCTIAAEYGATYEIKEAAPNRYITFLVIPKAFAGHIHSDERDFAECFELVGRSIAAGLTTKRMAEGLVRAAR